MMDNNYSDICDLLDSKEMEDIIKYLPKDKAKILDSIINKIKEVAGNEEESNDQEDTDEEDTEESSETNSNATDSKKSKRTLEEPFSNRIKLKDKQMEGYIISLSRLKNKSR